MRNFTKLNYLSKLCCSGRLVKGLFLFTAAVLFTFTQGLAQEAMNGDYTPDPSMYTNFDALRGSSLAKNGDGELPETAANPMLDPNTNCDDLDVVLVLDESGSMNGLAEQEARESALVLAQSFQGTNARLRILEFSAQARFIELDEFFVTQTYLDNFEDYLNGGYTSVGGEFQEYASMPGGTIDQCFPGYTNWDDAFQTINEDAPEARLVLFLTDGNPTAYNGGEDFEDCGYTVSVSPNGNEAEIIMESLAAAINSSNVLKTDPVNPTKIFPIGVGNGVNVGNLALISGPTPFSNDIFNEDYAVGDIEDIQINLTAGINSICGTVLSLEKSVDIDEVCNGDQVVTFTIKVTNVGFDNGVERDAENVLITDVFPDELDVVEGSLPDGAVLAEDGQTVTFEIPSLPFGEGEYVEIDLQATVSQNGTFTNNVSAVANNANEVSASKDVLRADILTDVLEITSCGPYLWEEGDQIIETSVSGEVVQITRNGCPVNVTLEVTIDEEQDPIVRNVEACGGYTWVEEGVQFGDEPITVSSPEGEPYTLTVPGANGECDQVYNLNLTILDAPNTDIVENFCDVPVDMSQGFPQLGYFPDTGVEGVIWNFPSGGTGFIESGVYIGTLEVEDGCDETFTLYLTISENEVGAPCPLVGDEPGEFSGETTEDCGCEGTPDPCADAGGDTDGDGICDDDEIEGCQDETACNYNDAATDEGDCIFAEGDCESCSGETDGTGTVVLNDEDGDGICDDDEIEGCQDETACNYNDTATDEGDCIFAEGDCESCSGETDGTGTVVLNDEDGDGICDDDEVEGCQDETACNYNNAATDEGDCIFADEDCESCSGETDGTGTVVINDADGDGICDGDDPCPELADLENGDDCDAGNGQVGTVINCECVPDNDPGVTECLNFKTFYANHGPGVSGTDLYGVTYIGSSAVLSLITNVDFEAHIGYNPETDEVYLVNASGSEVVTYEVGTGAVSATPIIGNMINQLYAVVYNPADGLLYVGDANDDEIYTVDLDNGNTNLVATGPVQGGDLAIQDGQLYLASRGPDMLYEISGGSASLVGSIPSTVNGMAQANNATGLVVARAFTNEFVEVDAADGTTIQTYTAYLQGDTDPFELANGDMAAGCAEGDDSVVECYPNEVLAFNQGLQTNNQPVAANRSNPAEALGMPDQSNAAGGFVSLGVGGSITLGFPGGALDGPDEDIYIFETSFSGDICNGASDERADIELSEDGINFVAAGTICRDGIIDMADFGLSFVQAIRITNSASTGSLDGYDVDGVIAKYGCDDNQLDVCPAVGECYAQSVVASDQGVSTPGSGSISPARSNPDEALFAPEGTNQLVFFSLGQGGSITLEFGGEILNEDGDDIQVIETTFNNPGCEEFPEYADVSVSEDGANFFFLETICKANNAVDISDAEVELDCVKYVRIANNDELTTQNGDGFDVDGVIAIHNCVQPPVVNNGQIAPEGENTLASFPNPTSGMSQAVFVTGQTERATLEVYDINGRLVEGLFSGIAEAGVEYRIDFDGLALPNGVYMYRLTTESETKVDKFMIAR